MLNIAYRGRNTWALLTKCAKCGKPYDGRSGWEQKETRLGKNVYLQLMCRECAGKEKR